MAKVLAHFPGPVVSNLTQSSIYLG